MNQFKKLIAVLGISLTLFSCVSYNAYQKARTAEQAKDWDAAVIQYEKALEISPDNRQYQVGAERARRESSRAHFEKGKSLRAAAAAATGNDQYRLAQLAATELQLTVRLDSTNQFAAVELAKALQLLQDIQQATTERVSVDDVKRRSQSAISKAQPPQLNPASNEPISLTFSRDTPVKDIYRALGNAYGINIVFDQAVKDDRITIELRDVTALAALERVMQAANHFYKVLDEKTIIVVPDNPQSRRDYEDLVIRTFYLSNGDAEQVTNVVRTMIEARNVFPLKALNAITIRDTADKVRIAEKIIQANDKAKAEVVVQVELVQLDVSRLQEIGMALSGFSSGSGALSSSGVAQPRDGTAPFSGGTLADIARVVGSLDDLRRNVTFSIPTATYSLLKTAGNSELLANPELRISEGEKATLHIGNRIPVPVTTFTTSVQGGGTVGSLPATSFQYQDVGIKVAIEPRVHHNREVTLKLLVEVSNQGSPQKFAGQEQPTFATRTIESTIRLKDGETNFLAGLIQTNKVKSATKTPFLGDLPFIGRLFTNEKRDETRTDLVLTMTPHIIRIPDITEEDLAPMWVGTGTNLTFRGMTPRVESQAGAADPFTQGRSDQQFRNTDAKEGEAAPASNSTIVPRQGGGPSDPFRRQTQPPPPTNNPPEATPPPRRRPPGTGAKNQSIHDESPDDPALRFAPRIAPQPSTIDIAAGETRLWEIVGMDLDGLTAPELVFRFDPSAMRVGEVILGSALAGEAHAPPLVTIDSTSGTISVRHVEGPLHFISGGTVLTLRVTGGVSGETYLVMNNPQLHGADGAEILAAVTGGRARVE